MNRLIEDYLRTRGVRYFRGHHDDEYFFLVGLRRRNGDSLKSHLNVHLEVVGAERDTVQVSITADRYYPATGRASLDELVARFSADRPTVAAVVHDSSDPRLVGLQARGTFHPVGLADLTEFVDAAVTGAVALFGDANNAVPPAQHDFRDARPGVIRDAG